MSLPDVFQISTDHAEACVLTCRTGVRLQTDTGKTCNDSQLFTEIIYQFTIPFSLVFGNKRVHTHKLGATER